MQRELSKKIIRVFFVLSLASFIFPQILHAQEDAVGAISGVYKTGNAPLNPKAKVTITQVANSIEITPLKGGEVWKLPFNIVRGVRAEDKTLWLYWFDSSDNTLTAQFQMDQLATGFANTVNTAIVDFHKGPSQMSLEQQQRYEQYKEQAIKESK